MDLLPRLIPADEWATVERGVIQRVVASETMPRDDVSRFMTLGRMLERAEMTCQLIDVRYGQPEATRGPEPGRPPISGEAARGADQTDFHQWMAVLKSASALEAYRRRYRSSMEPARIAAGLPHRSDARRRERGGCAGCRCRGVSGFRPSRDRDVPPPRRARYVSGYLFTADDSTGADSDVDEVHVETHAWVEVALPGRGWLALDPTNAQTAGERHVTIGRGRDYDDVSPFRGVFTGRQDDELDVAVRMRRLALEPLGDVPGGWARQIAQQQQQ